MDRGSRKKNSSTNGQAIKALPPYTRNTAVFDDFYYEDLKYIEMFPVKLNWESFVNVNP